MANRHIHSHTTPAALGTEYLDHRDEDLMQALVTAGALVALADGQLPAIERAELVDFVDRQGFVPTTTKRDIAEAFDCRVRELEEQHCARVIVETLRPLAGLSLASIVVRTAERVAGADGRLHPGEMRALELIRRVLMALPANRLHVIVTAPTERQSTRECEHCGTVLISPAWTESNSARQTVVIWRCAICGHEFETTENGVAPRLSEGELMRAYFPGLLVA
jgi:tellurite resistance protein/ribosomal protein L37AE/L43A